MSTPIRTRRVYLLTGYEPLDAAQHHHRFAREIKRFEKTWSLTAEVSPLVRDPVRPVVSWQARVSGPDWTTTTDVRLLAWDDVIAEDFGKPVSLRLWLYLLAAIDFFFSGTFFRYIATYWRYAFFAGYPAFLLLVFTLVAAAAGLAWGKVGLPLAPIAGPVIAFGVFLALMRWPGRRFHIDYMLNDWIFARDLVHRSRPSIEARAKAFAEEIAAGVAKGDVDEVVVVAHSLGAAWMIGAVAEAIRRDPAFATGSVPFGLVGVGSSTLKIALHPKAEWLRTDVKTVADRPDIIWAEYFSHVDFICFYKANTVETLGLEARSKPVSRSIRLSRMLAPETWSRFRGNLLRVHRQYVMGNEQRYAYDFHLIVCGPFPLSRIVHDGEAIPTALGPDGALAPKPDRSISP